MIKYINDKISNPLISSNYDIEQYNKLVDLYNDDPVKYTVRLDTKYCRYSELRSWIIEKTPNLNYPTFYYKFRHRTIWIFNGYTEFKKCGNPNCSVMIGYHDNVNCWATTCKDALPNYKSYCNKKCAMNDPENLKKIQETWMKTIGCDHPMRNKDIANKALQTYQNNMLEKYGVNHYFKTEQFIENRNIHNIEKYGVDTPIKLPEFKQKREQTYLDRFGVTNPMKLPEVIQKREQTCLERYGVTNASKLDSAKQKRIDTMMKKYNSTHRNKYFMYDNTSFDSSWELYLWIYCKDHNIEIIREPIRLEFEFNGKKYGYHPDFLIDGQLVELKGNQFFLNCDPNSVMIFPFDRNKFTDEELKILDECAEYKHQFMLNNNVKILTKCDMLKYIDYVQTKYGEKYIDQFNLRKKQM